jgi:hypothetical protein
VFGRKPRLENALGKKTGRNALTRDDAMNILAAGAAAHRELDKPVHTLEHPLDEKRQASEARRGD